jgi:branched-chain amino acid transport system permease protein
MSDMPETNGKNSGVVKRGAGGKAAAAFSLAAAIGLPILMQAGGQYHLVHIMCLIGIYVILALGLNVIVGYTGTLNLGFAAFYGVGAYSAALIAIHTALPFWIVLPLSGLFAAAAGALIGMPTLRLRGDYIAIVTLGFVEIVRIGFNNLDPITNGPKGLPRIGETIPTPALFSFRMDSDMKFYFFILATVLGVIFVMARLNNSRVGRSLTAIREDEVAAETMGVNTTYMKIQAFAIGTFFAGLAGCIYAYWIGFITPELFTFWESVLIVAMIVLGGMGSIPGVILGTVLIVGIPEGLRDVFQIASENISSGAAASWRTYFDNIILARMLVFGAIMIIMVIFRPQGILPARRPTIFGKHPAPAEKNETGDA